MNPFLEKLVTLWPEMIMLVGAVACLATGLAPQAAVRKTTPWVAAGTMVLAWIVTLVSPVQDHPLGFGGIVPYVKCLALAMGLILLMLNVGLPDKLRQSLSAESSKKFDPGNCVRGEFYCFFLLSITGVMLTAGATDLVWLFLALELTSLPTYVMIATSRDRLVAQESAIKYFFLGALSAAVFLYGFALIYGATGFTEFGQIAGAVAEMENGPSSLMILGLVLSILGLCFKIAAVPMHVYAADVYEGAATPMTAFLAVVPKTAGFAALILVIGLVGWNPLPEPIAYLLIGIAVLTMTVGNVLAFIQTNLKRVLAYSSIAHSGYLLTGLVAGFTPDNVAHSSEAVQGGAMGNGVAAVLFYLLAYGMATAGSFAVLACIRAKHPDIPGGDTEHDTVTYDDLSGLWWKNPVLAGIMLVAMLSLVGMPPLAGFVGKVYLIGSTFTAGYAVLAVVIVLNSAISAGYYLRIAMTCFFGMPLDKVSFAKAPTLIAGAVITTVAAFALGGFAADGIITKSHDAVVPLSNSEVVVPDTPATTSSVLDIRGGQDSDS
ncbi:MAG: NADH-quinone oxidoreductase subunit N [Planctomycetota bacterium]